VKVILPGEVYPEFDFEKTHVVLMSSAKGFQLIENRTTTTAVLLGVFGLITGAQIFGGVGMLQANLLIPFPIFVIFIGTNDDPRVTRVAFAVTSESRDFLLPTEGTLHQMGM
jgi:hypothetical protein